MSRIRLPLICILALALTTLACILPIGSANPTPTVLVIEVTATPLIPPTAAATSPSEAVPATQEPSSGGATASPPATLPPDCMLDSDFVSDVNIPDRSPIKANSVFVKTWRLRNSSTCPWNSTFKFVQISGGMLTATPNTIPLPDVPMGGEVEISMTLTLSSAAPIGSEQTARFQIQAPDGRLFGTRPFVKILVASSTGSITDPPGSVWEDGCRVISFPRSCVGMRSATPCIASPHAG